MAITFYEPLDKESAEQPDAYKVKRWNYKWTNEYGSLHYRIDRPDEEGEDDVEVLSATLLDDRTVFLEIKDMRPVNQLTVDFQIRAADKTTIRNSIYYTLHEIPKAKIDSSRLASVQQQDMLRKDDPRLEPGLLLRFRQDDGSHTRLFWSSDSIAEEPIPPTSIYHTHDDVDLGARLYDELGCIS